MFSCLQSSFHIADIFVWWLFKRSFIW